MGGGSAEGSEARKNGMGGMGWDGTWDMGWAWACSSSPEAVCMQSSGAVLGDLHTGLYATSAAGQGTICSYADIALPGLARLQMRGTSSSVSLWGVCVGREWL